MSSYIIYDSTSGAIIKLLKCPVADVAANTPAGAAALASEWPSGPAHVNPITHVLVIGTSIETRTLTQIKDDKWALIKDSRANVDYTPIVVGAYTYDADEVSRARIQNTIQLMLLSDPPTATVSWTLANNSVVTITRAQLIAVGMAIWSRTVAAFNQGQALRDEVYASANQAAVDAVGLVVLPTS